MILNIETQEELYNFSHAMLQAHGKKNQVVKAAEELNELQDQLLKSYSGRTDKDHIAEELADVIIVLAQIKLIYNLSTAEIEDWLHYKIERELDKLHLN